MNFNDNEDPINLDDINLIELMLESESLSDDARSNMENIRGEMSDAEMSLDELGVIANFVDHAVKLAFEEVIAMANMLGQESVPVVVLKALSQQQSIATKMLWDAADFTGIKLTTETPDDLSGLGL